MEVQPTRELIQLSPGPGYRTIAQQVRRGELVRLRRGAVRDAGELTPEQRLRLEIEATARVLHCGTWFSHRSAALLHGLPVFILPSTVPEVIRTFGGHGERSHRLHSRAAELPPDECHLLDGLPVTSVVRTVIDLARLLPFPQTLMAVDVVLARGITRECLLAGIRPGRGAKQVERAMLAGDALSESPGESESRGVMICAGLPLPALQVCLYDRDGQFLARPDFFWKDRGIVGEYDGEGKYAGAFGGAPERVFQSEKRRQAALEAEGYFVLRWGKEVLRQPGELARRLRRALASRPPRAAYQPPA